MTDREFYKEMDRRQERVFGVVRELHIAGFSSIFVESMAVGREQYWCRIFIASTDIDVDRFAALVALCNELENVKLALNNDRDLGTRLTVWVGDADS
jgi:hypothetical protein